MVGLVNAYQISGNNKYLQKSMDVWQFVKDKIVDHQKGEWFWRVDKFGVPNEQEDKAGFWKCPYHNGRACMEVIDRIGSVLSKLS